MQLTRPAQVAASQLDPWCWADVSGDSVTKRAVVQDACRTIARGTTWQRLCTAASELPGVEQGTSYRTPSLQVRKKLLARLREDASTVAMRIDLSDRDVILEVDPKAFFLTDHYRPYPWVVMSLAQVHHAAAMELLEQAWRRVAPQRLVAEYEASGSDGGASRVKGEAASDRPRRRTTQAGRGRRPTKG
jgi:hypothetical protein